MFVIDNKEISTFNKFGFILRKNFFDKRQVSELLKSIKKLQSGKNLDKDILRYYENSILNRNKKILVRAENFYRKEQKLTKFINDQNIKSILKKILKKNPILFKEKINFKPSGCRADTLHQDSQAGWDKFTKNFINVLISIEKSTQKNGCLQFDISGNNCSKLVKKDMSPLKYNELKKPKFKSFELDVGDVIFFNNYIPHKSKPNKSGKSRIQIYLTYNSSSAGNFRKKYISEKRKSFPPNNERLEGLKYNYKI